MINSCCVHSSPACVRFCWIQFHDKERKKPSDNFPHLCQRLDTCVNVATGNLRDDKVDRGGCAVVQVIKVRRDRAHPWSTEEIKATLKIDIWHFSIQFSLDRSASATHLGSGIMMGSSSSSSLCWTRSGSSHTLLWSISIMSRSSWNSLGMDGWLGSLSCAFWRAWLDGRREGEGERAAFSFRCGFWSVTLKNQPCDANCNDVWDKKLKAEIMKTKSWKQMFDCHFNQQSAVMDHLKLLDPMQPSEWRWMKRCQAWPKFSIAVQYSHWKRIAVFVPCDLWVFQRSDQSKRKHETKYSYSYSYYPSVRWPTRSSNETRMKWREKN